MGILLGFSYYGNAILDDDMPPIRDVEYAEFNKSILDEIHLSESKKELIKQSTFTVDYLSNGQIDSLNYDSNTPNLVKSIAGLSFGDITGVTFSMLRLTKFK